jgi:prevent-host-death family protein
MKTATMCELRNQSRKVLGWVEAGEEVVITRSGEIFARLVPEKHKRLTQARSRRQVG